MYCGRVGLVSIKFSLLILHELLYVSENNLSLGDGGPSGFMCSSIRYISDRKDMRELGVYNLQRRLNLDVFGFRIY